MNIRQSITRNITYSNVTVSRVAEEPKIYTVYGETTPTKEMKKYLKSAIDGEIPTITVETVTEKRAISIEDFIKNSILINESEDVNNG
jgi:hypothetical protein